MGVVAQVGPAGMEAGMGEGGAAGGFAGFSNMGGLDMDFILKEFFGGGGGAGPQGFRFGGFSRKPSMPSQHLFVQ